MKSSDTFEVIDINGDTMRTTPVNTPTKSSTQSPSSAWKNANRRQRKKYNTMRTTPSKSSTSTPPPAPKRPVARHRYNLRRIIKKPIRYGDDVLGQQHIIYDRHNTRTVYPDFRGCTVDYNSNTGGYTIYGFTYGKEYFTTRGASYVGLSGIECDSDDEDATEIVPGSLKGFIIYPYGRIAMEMDVNEDNDS